MANVQYLATMTLDLPNVTINMNWIYMKQCTFSNIRVIMRNPLATKHA